VDVHINPFKRSASAGLAKAKWVIYRVVAGKDRSEGIMIAKREIVTTPVAYLKGTHNELQR
jgi:hypothetical protein